MFPGACGVGNACGTPLGWFSLIFSLWEVANRPQRLKIQKRPKTGPRKCHHPIGRNGLFQAPQVPRPNFGPFGPHGDPSPLFLGGRIHFCNWFVMVLPFWTSNVGVMCPYPTPPRAHPHSVGMVRGIDTCGLLRWRETSGMPLGHQCQPLRERGL
jgi:hypothetical protein